ncbi:FtsX-like permease family protein [Luethyella okanaganae]|uniref:FtsX-like permease family protein n=1 Tax=Luethyella okanaganae TaxID=69372 RepID=A0ABW1VJV9_9MICO
MTRQTTVTGQTTVTRRWNRWQPALRLARRDAARHRARTILATLLVALPVTALVTGTALTQSAPLAREAALAGIPDGVQAVVTATAVPRTGMPFPQLPEGTPGPWMDDFEQEPAGEDELAALLPGRDRLLPYWNSPRLLATTGTELKAGQEAEAGTGTVGDFDLAAVSTASLQEAGGEALALMLPRVERGAAPTNATEAVITSALADRLDIAVGDVVTFVAPPSTGWYSTDGRIGDVIQDSQRAYQVSGIVADDAQRVWAPEGWISRMATADPAGVDGHWLIVGDEPVSWEHARAINLIQAFAVSRHVLENYPAAGELYPVAVDAGAVLLQIVSVVLAGTVGALLVLFLVTPAFAVSTDQARRTLGLAAAVGGAPADLRRIITAQGLVIGLAGGTLGAVAGTATALLAGRALLPDRDLLAHFPWWIVPVAIGMAALLGVVATLLPARSASRLRPVDALKDHATPRSHRVGSHGAMLRRLAEIAGPIALAAAIACGAWSLALPSGVEPGYISPGAPPTSSSGLGLLLLLATVVLTIVGLLLSARAITTLGARFAGRLPIAFRLALRDAADHRSRFLPAATGVLVAVLAASYLAVLAGSATANDRDRVGEMVSGGRLVLGAQVPVSEGFDRLVIADAISVLADELPVTGHEPVYAIPLRESDVHLAAVMPENASCPDDLYPDTASAVRVGAPLHCTDWNHAYNPGLSVPWWGGSDTVVMTGDALRASGLPGADAAAAVLDAGGAVVNNAARLSDQGIVRVAISGDMLPDESNADRIVELPGAFLRGIASATTVSPETAGTLGVTELEYLGEYVVTDPELSLGQLARARQLIEAHTTLAWIGEPQRQFVWGRSEQLLPIALLAALALAATTISLLLAHTQTLRDFTTMHAVGAAPRFLRRFALTQAIVILAASVPIGLTAGVALGAYQIAWNRKTAIGGAWLETVPLWGVQAALALAVVGIGLATAVVVARPPRQLVRRSID